MSQTITALLRLRELILSGELPAGERVSELSVVDRLGVSRTPIRAALARLEEEGLLDAIPSGGYAIRGFTERDILDAIELRGTLEGLAARFAAERGVGPTGLADMRAIVARIDEVVGAAMSETDFDDYVALNAAFHTTLVGLAGSPTLSRQIDRALALPFASPSAFVMARAAFSSPAFAIDTQLIVAQDQHRSVVEAIERREGARAEAIMREHVRHAQRNVRHALADRATLRLVPGGALFAPRARA